MERLDVYLYYEFFWYFVGSNIDKSFYFEVSIFILDLQILFRYVVVQNLCFIILLFEWERKIEKGGLLFVVVCS